MDVCPLRLVVDLIMVYSNEKLRVSIVLRRYEEAVQKRPMLDCKLQKARTNESGATYRLRVCILIHQTWTPLTFVLSLSGLIVPWRRRIPRR